METVLIYCSRSQNFFYPIDAYILISNIHSGCRSHRGIQPKAAEYKPEAMLKTPPIPPCYHGNLICLPHLTPHPLC